MAPDRRELVAPEIYLGERGQKLLQPLRRVESLQLVGGHQLAQVSAKERHKVGAGTCGWRCARRAACGADAELSWAFVANMQHTAVTTKYMLLIRSQGMHDFQTCLPSNIIHLWSSTKASVLPTTTCLLRWCEAGR